MTSSAAPALETDGYAPGDCISDRYVLVRILGAGGMGVVWLAYSTRLDVHVALKLLHSALAGTQAVDRMSREARAAAKLGHHAMARVLDFGQTRRGHPFLVMELLHGESLREMLERKGRLDAIRAVRTLLPIADALATAHDKGIIHRDVKPGNVFIARDEHDRVQPKLLDFGIAKLDDAQVAQRNHKLTEVGTVLGSPDYLSPEQAQGRQDIDGRADVWAFAVMLYEALCGEPPFQAENYNALLHAILTLEPVPVTEHAAGDAALWQVLAKGLSKQRDERWASMWEIGHALAEWLISHEVYEDICSNSLKARWLGTNLPTTRVAGQTSGSEPPQSHIPSVGGPPRGSRAGGAAQQVTQVTRTLERGPRRSLGTPQTWVVLTVVAGLVVGSATAMTQEEPLSVTPLVDVVPPSPATSLPLPVAHPEQLREDPPSDAPRNPSLIEAASGGASAASTKTSKAGANLPAAAAPRPASPAIARPRKKKQPDFGF